MKNAIIAVVVIVVVGIAGYMLLGQNSDETSMVKDDTSMMKDDSSDAMMKDDKMQDDGAMIEDDKMMADSRYVEFTDGILDSTSGRRVLYFYANWCPTCRPADADFKANADKLPEDVTVIRVNYNDTATDASEEALADEYGVTYQHTFVQIDEEGNKITSWNGGQLSELLSNIK